MGSVKLGVKLPNVTGEIGEGRNSGAECEDSDGLVAPCSCFTRICGSGVGLGAMNGRFSETFANKRGRKREPPPRSCAMRLSSWLRQSEGTRSTSDPSRGTQAITSVRVQAMSNSFSI